MAPARVLGVPDAQVARARMRGEALEGVHARGLQDDARRRQQLRCDRLRQLLVRLKRRQTVPVIAQLLLFLCTVSDEHDHKGRGRLETSALQHAVANASHPRSWPHYQADSFMEQGRERGGVGLRVYGKRLLGPPRRIKFRQSH
eukprot:scaffold95020_cov72-Phaeocystis_antarctica.AAC.2